MSWFENPGVETFNGLKMSDLSVDEAWLIVSSSSSVPLWLYSLSENCHHVRKSVIITIYKFSSF